jgi:hypothetical protein
MRITFDIPMKVFSINQMSARDQRFKTAAYKDWATAILQHLQNMAEYKELLDMGADFKANGGHFFVSFTAFYPPHVFYTKQGAISSKTVDCTNFGKPLLDLIFGDTMDVNDKNVVECTERKAAGASFFIKVTIEMRPLSTRF